MIKKILLFIVALLPTLLPPAPAQEAEKGLYHAVVPRERERPLIENAGEYEGLFLRRGYRYVSPELEALVQSIGQEIAPDPLDPYVRYRFFIVREPDPSAFALPDGQIYISTGLLALLENEAQVAAVLAHEIAHVEGHHGILNYRKARKSGIASIILGPLTLGIGDVFLIESIYGYSKALEREADERGFERMLEYGWDVREIVPMLQALGVDIEGERVETKPKWSSHDEIVVRVAETQARLAVRCADVDLGSLRRGAQGFYELTRTAALETVQDFLRKDYPRSAVHLAGRLIERDPENPQAHRALGDALFGLRAKEATVERTRKEKRQAREERLLLTREERSQQRLEASQGGSTLRHNLESARRAYLEALRLEPELAEAHRGLGYVLESLGEEEEAGKSWVAYLRLRPQALDRSIVLHDLEEIVKKLKEKESSDANKS